MNPTNKSRHKLANPFRIIAEFIRLESSGGIILFAAAVLALIIDNSPWHNYYEYWRTLPLNWSIWHWHFATPVDLWINEVLMTFFFLLVGLEIKREICIGELNSFAKVSLSAIAAIGGMVVPALIYIAFTWGNMKLLPGWAIPTATDIAFALGIMALLGKKVPLTVKLFLMALAIFDDIGAIIIIGIFYQSNFCWPPLLGVLACLAILWWLNYREVSIFSPYITIGILLWIFLLQSGIHPTLAGVLLAFSIPLYKKDNGGDSPSRILERRLHPWVAYIVLPLFSFVNAGVSFEDLHFSELFTPLSLGIIAGLFIGKQLGIFGASWLVIRLKWAPMPKGSNWLLLYGTSLVCGVGFTMSLFIGHLAFDGGMDGDTNASLVRFGVFMGSCLSGLLGYILLHCSAKNTIKITHLKKSL